MKTYLVEIALDDKNSEDALLSCLESFGNTLDSYYANSWSVNCSDENGDLILELGHDLEDFEEVV